MAAFKYGEWDYICRVSPQPICNLFFRQLLVHPDHGIQAAPDQYLGLPTDPLQRDQVIKELGLGIRSSCSIPRMQSAGGKVGSVGNIANIMFCFLSIIVTLLFIFKAFKRKAAVARIEMIIFLAVFSVIKFFEILDTGSILKQGSRAIVWITSIHHSLLVLFYFILIWLGFLSLQLVEDGSKFSLVPLFSSCLFLFIGSIYIYLDTAFGVTHYFSSQPAGNLYSPWTFSMVILWPFISITIYLTLTILVSIKGLLEQKPAISSILTLVVLAIAETFRWVLTQPICHSSNATVDASFIGTILELIAISLVLYTWICLTESDWEDEDYDDLGFNSNKFSNRMSYHHPNTDNHEFFNDKSKLDESNNMVKTTAASHVLSNQDPAHRHPDQHHLNPSSTLHPHSHLDFQNHASTIHDLDAPRPSSFQP